MFKSIDTLSSFDKTIEDKSTKRWHTPKGINNQKLVIKKILNNELNHLLDADVQDGELNGFLDDEWDLKGLIISKNEFKTFENDVFHAIDFSYASFHNVIFEGFIFYNVIFDFAKFVNCKFISCGFRYMQIYGCVFENCEFVRCDLLDRSGFYNSTFPNTSFTNCFSISAMFKDCKFDVKTTIDDIIFKPNKLDSESEFNSVNLKDYYAAIYEAYEAGEVTEKRREFLFKSKSAYRKNNTSGLTKVSLGILEFLAGYGLKPLRPVRISIIIIFLFSIVFTFQDCNYANGLLTSISAFLTIGDTDSLKDCLKWCFLIEGFLGVFSLGLFLATLLNVWFSEK